MTIAKKGLVPVMERRDFVKAGAALCTLGLTSLTGCATQETSAAQIVSEVSSSGGKKQLGLVVNVSKLNELGVMDEIASACHTAHNVPDVGDAKTAIKWIRPASFEQAFEDLDNAYMSDEVRELEYPVLCNHCEEPPCVRVCPTKATFKRSDGIVSMDYHRCIGCRFCVSACPYGARSLNFSDPRKHLSKVDPTYPTRSKGVVEKCMFCSERIDKGELPLCVEASKGAIVFGDLTDEASVVRRALANAFSIRRRVEIGTGPNIYYLFEGGE
ncbi:MAG: 4Fe-4S dicluster domain-containing protein [Gordonibacter sp.]|uniref:sulfate reduction electron transfer complex DsrMKJOP subunit DsrO n=3 Tax=Gordonibacter sp. TaxID=1968902 RepID=UPI002FC86AB0